MKVQRWEYRLRDWNVRGTPSTLADQDLLNVLSAEGWELVSVVTYQATADRPEIERWYMRRQKREE